MPKMKTLRFLILSTTILSTTSACACHRYKFWHYRFRQHCDNHVPAKTKPIQPQQKDDRTWFVDIVLPTDEELRQRAIEELNKRLHQME